MSLKIIGKFFWTKSRAFARYLTTGLAAIGHSHYSWSGDWMPPEEAMVPGHPERLVSHLRPSDEERRLWAQFGNAPDEARW
ncbi:MULTISPECIES: DUF6059 family protein [unclassified Nonomuraea]|uniref:DUF6059 family protein n=1 Tax=unclassified Nonomuraea TaxID=2593643 RepID=UPI00340360C7